MKQIVLKTLRLFNFKGIRELVIELDGNTNIFGANEVGKSTIYTAFTWLLTGKDEFDRKDYEIKNTKHKELNSQSHEVEAVLIVNGREEKLKRVYLEKWVKQKGQSVKTFEGHKTEFYYNDVPCNLSEYQAKVDAIISPAIIKLVTNPTYFNSLKWEDQRRGLLGIAGDITNNDVIGAISTNENDFATLIKMLNSGKTLDEFKKELSAKKLLLKKAASEFLPRIDEAKRSLPEAQDWLFIERSIDEKKGRISEIDLLLTDASAALAQKQKGIMAKQKQVHAKQTELANIRFNIRHDLQMKQSQGSGEISNLQQQIRNISDTIARLKKSQTDIATNRNVYQQQIDNKNEFIAKLRSEWSAINAERFSFDESKCECPTCKQALPAAEVEDMRNTLLKNFAESVARRKADKVAISNQAKAEIKQLQENIEALDRLDYNKSIDDEQEKLKSLNTKLSTLQLVESKKKVEDLDAATDALLKVNAKFLNLQDEINTLEVEINVESEALEGESTNQAFKAEKLMLQAEIDTLRKQLSAKDTIARTEARIVQLQSEEQANAQAIADLEQQEFEIETFTRAKMDILQNRVNGMFKYVKFRLFDIQVNQGIAETCVCEYNGVPYPTLNTAAKLLAGLDVLNTLSNFYGVNAPVFIDNRESISWIPDSPSQIISLYVSPNDRSLRVEKAERKLLRNQVAA